MSLIKARLVTVSEDALKDLFKENYSQDILEEFSVNNFRAEVLRRDFNIPTISIDVRISADRKYIIIDNKPMLAENITKISLDRI
jgi:hypothetical protein